MVPIHRLVSENVEINPLLAILLSKIINYLCLSECTGY